MLQLKMKLKQLLFIFVVFVSLTKLNAQITINTSNTPTQLVDGVLVPSGSGTTISNVAIEATKSPILPPTAI